MPRVILLAIGLSVLLWAADTRTGSATPDDIITMSATGSGQVAGDSHGPSDSDRQWRDRQHTIAAVTESAWKSAPVHAALAATPSAACPFAPVRAASSHDPPVRSAPHYLRHTPLLI